MSTSFAQSLKDSVPVSPETLISQLAMKNYTFCRSDQGISFSEMKKRLGQAFAVPFERQYRGVEELEMEKREALGELNDLLEVLDRKPIGFFPKGSPGPMPITPVDLVLNRPVFNQSSFWYVVTLKPSDAMLVANRNALFGVVDMVDEKVISTERAAARLQAYDDAGAEATFGISLPEMLNSFLNDWLEGLFPELEASDVA